MAAPPAPLPDIHTYASQQALQFGLDPVLFSKVVSCESQWNPLAVGDSGASYGLVQIHLPSHPEITQEEALDPYFALNWMAYEWSVGHAKQWSCYRKIKATYSVAST